MPHDRADVRSRPGRSGATSSWEPARDLFAAQVDQYVELLAGQLDGESARGHASVTLAAMVGAVTIARALGPTPASDALLRNVRAQLRECSPAPHTPKTPEPAPS